MGAGGAHGGLLEPPFYMDAFEEAFRFVLEDYRLPARRLAIFIPCAVRKPYSTSPSHRLFHGVLDRVLAPEEYQLLIFGTCGVVPAELERMYPFAHYRYMLGNVHDERVRRDFLEIETYRLAAFLEATRGLYERRAAYCIGLFREAMVRAVERSGSGSTCSCRASPRSGACTTRTARSPRGRSRAPSTWPSSRAGSPRSPADVADGAVSVRQGGEETAGVLRARRSRNGALWTDRSSLRFGRSSSPPTTGFPIRPLSVQRQCLPALSGLCRCLLQDLRPVHRKGTTPVNIAVRLSVRDDVHRVVESVCLLPNQSSRGNACIGATSIYMLSLRIYRGAPRIERTISTTLSIPLFPVRTPGLVIHAAEDPRAYW